MVSQGQFKSLIEGGEESADPEKLARAQAVLERMLASNPGEAQLYYYLGMILGRREEWEKACGYFKRAIELDPQCSEYDIWHKKAEKESLRSPLQRYRSSLRQLYSQIGESVALHSEELSDPVLHKALQEKIELASSLRKKIACLSPKKSPAFLQPVQDRQEACFPAALSVPPIETRHTPPVQDKKTGLRPTSGKKEALLGVKKELKSLYQFLSGGIEQDKALPPASEKEPSARENALTDRHRYREDLDALDAIERLQLLQFFEDLESSDRQSRSWAVDRLGEKNLGVASPVLLKRWLEEPVPEIQLKIVSILVRQGYAPLVTAARKVLEEDRTYLMLSAMEALYRFDWQTNLPYLQKALRSKVSAVKKRAVTYIGWVKDRSSIPELIRLLRDPDTFVRKTVISALVSMKVKRSVHFLIEVLMDPDPGVRSYVQKALNKLIGETLDYDPQANFIRRRETVERLNIWWEAEEEEFSLDERAADISDTHVFPLKLTSDSERDEVIKEEILSAVSMSEDGADLLEIGEKIGISRPSLAQKVEQLRQEGKLEKTDRKYRNPEKKFS